MPLQFVCYITVILYEEIKGGLCKLLKWAIKFEFAKQKKKHLISFPLWLASLSGSLGEGNIRAWEPLYLNPPNSMYVCLWSISLHIIISWSNPLSRDNNSVCNYLPVKLQLVHFTHFPCVNTSLLNPIVGTMFFDLYWGTKTEQIKDLISNFKYGSKCVPHWFRFELIYECSFATVVQSYAEDSCLFVLQA